MTFTRPPILLTISSYFPSVILGFLSTRSSLRKTTQKRFALGALWRGIFLLWNYEKCSGKRLHTGLIHEWLKFRFRDLLFPSSILTTRPRPGIILPHRSWETYAKKSFILNLHKTYAKTWIQALMFVLTKQILNITFSWLKLTHDTI